MTFLPTPARISEAQFQAQVVKLAELYSWRWYHTLRSKGSAAGFPDLVLVRARHPKPRVIFAEIKADRTPVTDDQRAWIDELRACDVEVYIWRPKHFERIEKLLR
jgi:VRR-NUC domain